MTFREWRWCIRIRPCVSAVLRGDRQMAEIAYAAGYAFPSEFNREFKRVFGLAPKEFRALSARGRAHP